MIRGCRGAALILVTAGALLAPAAACAAAVPVELVSGGAPGAAGNGPHDACDVSIQCLDFEASADGSRAFFSTAEPLLASDVDQRKDVYERQGATIVQVSTGVGAGNGNFDATLQGISGDGTRAVFGSYEPLTRDDLDLTSDVYERASEVRLVSTGPATSNLQLDVCEPGSASAIACFGLATGVAGNPVFFTTPESLTFDDLDVGCFTDPPRCADVYRRSGESTTLVSVGTGGAEGATLVAVSPDGTGAFFLTRAPLTPADGDAAVDLYERAGTTLRLVSAGTVAGAPAADAIGDVRVSTDGTRVVFATAERLAGADTDAAVDIYERAGGVTTLVSGQGTADVCDRFDGCPGLAVSSDGTHIVFETRDQLSGADTDSQVDVYERTGATTALVSAGGTGSAPAYVESISSAGSRVLFSSAERITPEDTDAAVDVYERVGGVTKLVSTGSQTGNGPFAATAEGTSAGGSRAVFSTLEALVPEDTDEATDLYVRAGDATSLLSGGSADEPAFFLDMAADGRRVFFGTAERLAAADTDGAIDVYAADLTGLQAPPEEPPPTGGGGGGGSGGGGDEGDPGTGGSSSGGTPGAGGGAAGVVAPPAAAGGAGDSAPVAAAAQAAFAKRLKASAAGLVGLRVRCPGPGSCRGRIVVQPAGKGRAGVLGRKAFTTAAGRTATVRVKLSRKARRTLARKGRLKATIVVQALDAHGALASSSVRTVTIRAAQKRRL